MKTNKLFLLVAVFALTPLLLHAQIDEKAMQSDISILEEVLNTLLSPADSPEQVSSRGLYLPGYGVIFTVNYGRGGHFYFPKHVKVDLKRVQESHARLQQELKNAFEEKAKERQQQDKLDKELEKSEEALALAEDEIARVEEELAKVAEATAEQRAAEAEREVQRAAREVNRLGALYEVTTDSTEAKKAREIIAALKKNLTRFYADYAQGLRNLPASERIMVLINFEETPFFTGLPGNDKKNGLMDFYVSLARSEVPALRKSRTPESLLHFQDAKTNQAVDRELTIFADILSNSVNEKAGKGPWGGSGNRSLYVPGYGAIIMLSASHFDFAGMEAFKAYAEKASTADKVWSSKEGIPSPEDSWKKKMPRMKEQIIDQIARYGGSLHALQPNENIMVVLSSQQDFLGDDRTPDVSIAARMSDVSKVFHEEISLPAFKNTLAIQEY